MYAETALTLGEYITALIAALATAQPASHIRMRQVVGAHRARITLDHETVLVYFAADGLRIEPDSTAADGAGATVSATVLDLLAGRIEVTQAILDGSLQVTGAAEAVVRMFQAIEILLDAAPRTPELQALADRFHREHHSVATAPPTHAWYPFASRLSELELLARLGLLP